MNVALETTARTVVRRTAPLSVGVLVAALAFLRLPSSARDALYAEDGTIFTAAWLDGGIDVLWRPYAGYQHLIPRLASWLVTTVFPVDWWGVATSAVACSIVGLLASLVYCFSGGVTGWMPARWMAALLVVLTPLASNEPLGNLANLHWFAFYLCPWVLISASRTTARRWGSGVLVFLLTMTEPQCALLFPLAAWAWFRRPGSRLIASAWAAGVSGQVVTYALAPRPSNPGSLSVGSLVDGYVLNGGMALATSSEVTLAKVLRHVGWWPSYVAVTLMVCGILVACRRAGPSERAAAGGLLWGSFTSWTLAFVVNNDPTYDYAAFPLSTLSTMPTVRWGTSASMMLGGAVIVAVAVLRRRQLGPGWLPGTILGVGLLVLMTNFLFVTSVRKGDHQWSDDVRSAEAFCSSSPDGSTRIIIQPTDIWFITVSCDEIR